MGLSVRALLMSKDDRSSFWVAAYARGLNQGLLALPGGKVEHDETPIPALRRELQEETGLPEDAFDVPLIHCVEQAGEYDASYCFLVWLQPGHQPSDSEEMVNWRLMTFKEAMSSPRFVPFCRPFLMDWMEREDCPFEPSAKRKSP